MVLRLALTLVCFSTYAPLTSACYTGLVSDCSGNDMLAYGDTTLNECLSLCDDNDDCAGFTYPFSNGCILKSASCDAAEGTCAADNCFYKKTGSGCRYTSATYLGNYITTETQCTAAGGSGFQQCADTGVSYCCDQCTGSHACGGLSACACVASISEYLTAGDSCWDPSGQDCSCTSINIGDNSRSGGTVPSELSACTSLTKLSLNTGAMTGTIPPELSTLTSLTEINFGSNRGMTGSFPAELSTLTSLQKIFMDKNSFTGAIPPEWSTLTSLTNLCVS